MTIPENARVSFANAARAAEVLRNRKGLLQIVGDEEDGKAFVAFKRIGLLGSLCGRFLTVAQREQRALKAAQALERALRLEEADDWLLQKVRSAIGCHGSISCRQLAGILEGFVRYRRREERQP